MDELHLEKVQRRASRMIPYLQHLTYKEKLSRLGIPSLNFRQCCSDLINVLCIIKGIDDLDFDSFSNTVTIAQPTNTITNCTPPKSNKKIGQCSFSSRVVKPWNSLPVEDENVQIFKHSLAKIPFNLGVFDI